jgi:ubiquinone/menaquinone biosynthesis C-methylase UbiE
MQIFISKIIFMQSLHTINNFQAFQQIAKSIPAQDTLQSLDVLNRIQQNCLSQLDNPHLMRDYIFSRAMSGFFKEKEKHDHIYLKTFEIPQIKLFELLLKAYPVVRLSQEIANQHLFGFLRTKSQATLIDIGIGTGHQVNVLLQRLNADPASRLKRLKIVGIEPSKEALQQAKNLLEGFSTSTQVQVEFIPVQSFAEEITLENYQEWVQEGFPVIVNASLVLHHISTLEKRLKVLQTVRQLGASALVITEPNVNHFENDYAKRFENCFHHFSMCFEIIDQLDLKTEEKNALKLFFSREIDDILGSEEAYRVEKHHLLTNWLELCKQAGFRSRLRFPELKGVHELGIEVLYEQEAFWAVQYRNETAVGVLYQESNPDWIK